MDTVSKIRQKLDIVDVTSSYLSLKKAGKNYRAPCPFHNEDTPSFMISPELQIFKCFGCGEGGDMFTFVQKIEGIEFYDALELLADRAGVEIEKKFIDPNTKKKKLIYEINEATQKFYSHLLIKHNIGKDGLAYLTKKRKLTNKTIQDYKLGFAPNTWDTLYKFLIKKGYSAEDLELAGVVTKKRSGDGYIDKFRGRIMFPFMGTDNKILGFNGRDIVGRDPKYLNTQDTIVFNKSEFLYGLNLAKVDIKQKGAVFVEGQLDVLTSYQNGIKNVVAASGTALTINHLKIISRYTKEIIFCFDPDSAGVKATSRALDLANTLDLEVKVVIIPEKYDDLDDYILKDKNEAKKALKNPVPIYDFYLAASLKNNNKDTAYGKKKIVEELAVPFSKIKDNVVFDHYIKKLSKEIQTDERILATTIKAGLKNLTEETFKPSAEKDSVRVQGFMHRFFALILRLDLDTMGQLLYKLKSRDFTNDQLKEIYLKLKEYIDSSPSNFDIKYLLGTISSPEGKDLLSNAYLLDLGEISDVKMKTEAESLLSRIKVISIKRELTEISEQIKLAEMEKNSNEISRLSEKFTKVSKKLLIYDKK